MIQVVYYIGVAIVSYLIGSISSSVILSKAVSGKDIRESGSGNAGATNMLRTHGTKMGVITLVCDILKGIIAVLIGKIVLGFTDITALPYIAGVAVILGHNFPLFFGFKGGKGVATGLGVVMMLDWKIGLIVLLIALAIMAGTKYVSLGSIIAGELFAVLEVVKMIVTSSFNIVDAICVVIIGAIIVIRHKSNIQRLLNGTENKLKFGSKKNN